MKIIWAMLLPSLMMVFTPTQQCQCVLWNPSSPAFNLAQNDFCSTNERAVFPWARKIDRGKMKTDSFSRSVGLTLSINIGYFRCIMLVGLVFILPHILLVILEYLALESDFKMNGKEVKHCSLCFHNGEPEDFYRWDKSFNVFTLSIVRNLEIICYILVFQLSQLEDSRWEDRDLSSSSKVRLQHLWRHWRRGSHYQVGFTTS